MYRKRKRKKVKSLPVPGIEPGLPGWCVLDQSSFIEIDGGGLTIFQVPASWSHSGLLLLLGHWNESNSFHNAGCSLLCNTVRTAGITPHATGAGQLSAMVMCVVIWLLWTLLLVSPWQLLRSSIVWHCLVQSVMSFLASADDTGAIFESMLREYCGQRSWIQVVVAPPMYCTTPVWYRRSLPLIALQFSAIVSLGWPRNLHLLTSPVSQELASDRVHLDPVSGLHYVLHLFWRGTLPGHHDRLQK